MLSYHRSLVGHFKDVLCFASPNNGDVVASGSDDCSIRLWDLRVNSSAMKISAPNDESVASLEWHPTAPHRLFASSGSSIYEYDSRNASSGLLMFEGDDECDVNSISVNDGGDLMGFGDDDGVVRVISINAQSHCSRILSPQHCNICSCVGFKPHSENILVSAGFDKAVLAWDLVDDALTDIFDVGSIQGKVRTMFNPPFIHGLSFCPNGSDLVVAVGDGSFIVLDPQNLSMKSRTEAHRSSISSICWPNDEIIISGGTDKQVQLWSIGEEIECKTKIEIADKINSLHCVSNCTLEYVLVGSTSPTIELFRI